MGLFNNNYAQGKSQDVIHNAQKNRHAQADADYQQGVLGNLFLGGPNDFF